MNYCTDKFKATILNDMGHVSISDKLVHRVLVVRDELNNVKISLQVWWRENTEDCYQPGKGYFMAPRHAIRICRALSDSLTETETIVITNTQEYRVVKVEADKVFTISKWWRKGDEDSWVQGKSLAVEFQHVNELCGLLRMASSKTLHVK